MWKTTLKIPRDRIEEVKTIVNSGKFKTDETFIYEFKENLLIIKSETQDKAYKRGGWFVHNVDSRISYEVESD